MLSFETQKYYDDGLIDRNEVIKMQEELKEENVNFNTEEHVAYFIYHCNGDLQKAKSVLKKVYLFKKNIPELFRNRSYEEEQIKKQWRTIGLAASPEFFKDDGPIVYFRFVGAPAAEYNCIATIKALFMAIDTFIYENFIRGLTVCVDLKDMYVAHIFQINIKLLKKIMKYAPGGIDQFVSEIHFINGGFVIDKLYKILEMIFDKQIFEKFKFHNRDMNWDDFYRDYIPRNFLPSEYGGSLDSFEVLQEKLWDRFVKYKENFKIEERLLEK